MTGRKRRKLLLVEYFYVYGIAVKEMATILLAAATWGCSWHHCSVFFHCDNAAVVFVIQRHSAKDPFLLHLLRCLYFYAARFQFGYSAHHLPGVSNVAADALSRDNMSLFLSLVPPGSPSVVSKEVLDLLLWQHPDWGSQLWIRQFKATC